MPGRLQHDEDGDVPFLIGGLGAADRSFDLGPDLDAKDFEFGTRLPVLEVRPLHVEDDLVRHRLLVSHRPFEFGIGARDAALVAIEQRHREPHGRAELVAVLPTGRVGDAE